MLHDGMRIRIANGEEWRGRDFWQWRRKNMNNWRRRNLRAWRCSWMVEYPEEICPDFFSSRAW